MTVQPRRAGLSLLTSSPTIGLQKSQIDRRFPSGHFWNAEEFRLPLHLNLDGDAVKRHANFEAGET